MCDTTGEGGLKHRHRVDRTFLGLWGLRRFERGAAKDGKAGTRRERFWWASVWLVGVLVRRRRQSRSENCEEGGRGLNAGLSWYGLRMLGFRAGGSWEYAWVGCEARVSRRGRRRRKEANAKLLDSLAPRPPSYSNYIFARLGAPRSRMASEDTYPFSHPPLTSPFLSPFLGLAQALRLFSANFHLFFTPVSPATRTGDPIRLRPPLTLRLPDRFRSKKNFSVRIILRLPNVNFRAQSKSSG